MFQNYQFVHQPLSATSARKYVAVRIYRSLHVSVCAPGVWLRLFSLSSCCVNLIRARVNNFKYPVPEPDDNHTTVHAHYDLTRRAHAHPHGQSQLARMYIDSHSIKYRTGAP